VRLRRFAVVVTTACLLFTAACEAGGSPEPTAVPAPEAIATLAPRLQNWETIVHQFEAHWKAFDPESRLALAVNVAALTDGDTSMCATPVEFDHSLLKLDYCPAAPVGPQAVAAPDGVILAPYGPLRHSLLEQVGKAGERHAYVALVSALAMYYAEHVLGQLGKARLVDATTLARRREALLYCLAGFTAQSVTTGMGGRGREGLLRYAANYVHDFRQPKTTRSYTAWFTIGYESPHWNGCL
jgi:hypothetical protein